MTVNNELERMWKEAGVAYVKFCPDIYLERLRKTRNLLHKNQKP
jgi:hypothetical protein